MAQDILHEIGSELAENDASGFAWGYLWRQATREFTQLWGHEARVHGPVISADGTTLATCDIAGKIFVWTLVGDVPLDRPRAMVTAPRSKDGEHRLNLSRDGRYLAVAVLGSIPIVDVFDTSSGNAVTRIRGEASEAVVAMDFDSSGSRLAVVVHRSGNGPLVRWQDIAHRSTEPRFWAIDHDMPIVALSAAGGYAGVYDGKNVRLFDLWTGACTVTLADSVSTTFAIAGPRTVSEDGRCFAALTAHNKILCWETGSGSELARFDVVGAVRIQLSRTGTRLAVMNHRGGVTVFDRLLKQPASFGPQTGEYTLRGHSMAFSSDETLLASVIDKIPGGIQPVKIHDLASSRRVKVFPGRRDIDSVSFIPGSHSVVVTGGTRPRIWRLDPPRTRMPWRDTPPRPGPLRSRPTASCWPAAAMIPMSPRRSSSGIPHPGACWPAGRVTLPRSRRWHSAPTDASSPPRASIRASPATPMS